MRLGSVEQSAPTNGVVKAHSAVSFGPLNARCHLHGLDPLEYDTKLALVVPSSPLDHLQTSGTDRS